MGRWRVRQSWRANTTLSDSTIGKSILFLFYWCFETNHTQPPSVIHKHTEDRLRRFSCSSNQSITTCYKLSKHENEQAGEFYIPLRYRGYAGCFPNISAEPESVSLLNEKRKLKFYISFSISPQKSEHFWVSVNIALFCMFPAVMHIKSIACLRRATSW